MKHLLIISFSLKSIKCQNYYSELSINLTKYKIKNNNIFVALLFTDLLEWKNYSNIFNNTGIDIMYETNYFKYLKFGFDININKAYLGFSVSCLIPKINTGISYNFIQKITNIYWTLELKNKKYLSIKVNAKKFKKLLIRPEIIKEEENKRTLEQTIISTEIMPNFKTLHQKLNNDNIIKNIIAPKTSFCNKIELILSDNELKINSNKEIIDLIINTNKQINKLILENRSIISKVKLYNNFDPKLYKLLENINTSLNNLKTEYKNSINNQKIEEQNDIFLMNFIQLISNYTKYENILINTLENKNELALKTLLQTLTKMTIIYLDRLYPYKNFINLTEDKKNFSKINYENINKNII